MKKYLIKNAEIIDGSGIQINKTEVIFNNREILDCGNNLYKTGIDYTYDAKGLVLAPGFIDAHSHSDISILAAPNSLSKVSQGITTEVVGNCGLSAFPITNKNREHLKNLYENYNVNINWDNTESYAEEFNRRNPITNLTSLIGLNTLRAAICGYEQQDISNLEKQKCKELLRQELERGAIGVSSGLIYVPGKFFKSDEICDILSILPSVGSSKIYATHLRSERDLILSALDEAIQTALQAKIKNLHISHLKTAGEKNWNKLNDIFHKIETNYGNKLSITADRYPFIESMTQLSIILPAPYDDLDDIAIFNSLQDNLKYKEILNKMQSKPDSLWERTRLVNTTYQKFSNHLGLNFDELGKIFVTEPAELYLDILKNDKSGAMGGFKGMSEDNMNAIIKKEYVCCGTDENARPIDFSIGRSHPRAFASFPKVFNILKQNMTIDEIIFKLSALPAKIFNIKNRGAIVKGYHPDLVIFNKDKFDANADFANPHIVSSGVDKVFVNGDLSYDNGEVPHKGSGIFLKN